MKYQITRSKKKLKTIRGAVGPFGAVDLDTQGGDPVDALNQCRGVFFCSGHGRDQQSALRALSYQRKVKLHIGKYLLMICLIE